MGRRRSYGSSREDSCPFCGNRAIIKNPQGLLVCRQHKKTEMPAIKCVCGSYLEHRTGKWGPYFYCINCGNISQRKGLEMQEMQSLKKNKAKDDDFILDMS